MKIILVLTSLFSLSAIASDTCIVGYLWNTREMEPYIACTKKSDQASIKVPLYDSSLTDAFRKIEVIKRLRAKGYKLEAVEAGELYFTKP